MKINRKKFFKGLAVATISTPFVLRTFIGKSSAQAGNDQSPNVITNKKYKWKMVTTWGPNAPVLGDACSYFADLVEKLSNGRMKIHIYAGGELVPALQSFDAVRNGSAEISNGAAYYWAGKNPAFQFFATVPFGMNTQQLTAWLFQGGGMELWRALYADYKVIPFYSGSTGVQMGGWFNREINSIDDLKGLKMRIPGLGGRVLEKAGGSAVLLAGTELYTGLERGVIDATEWLGPYHDYLMGFYQIAKYYYSPGWHEPGTALEFSINKEKYEALPKDLQAIIETATYQAATWFSTKMEAMNAEYLQKIQAEGIHPRFFPQDVLDALKGYTKEVIDDLVQSSPDGAKVYASYSAFRKKIIPWSNLTEKAFYNRLQSSPDNG